MNRKLRRQRQKALKKKLRTEAIGPEAFNQAVAFFQNGQFLKALDICRKILSIQPDHGDALGLGGMSAFQGGDLGQAVELLRRAVVLKPSVAEAHNDLAVVLQAADRLDEAQESFRRAIKINPKDPAFYNNLGVLLQRMGQLDEALSLLRQAVQVGPDYASAHNSLGNVLQDMGCPEEALSSFRRAIVVKPDYASAHRNLALCKSFSERDADMIAMEDLLSAVPENGEQAMHLNFALGKVLDELGDFDTAFKHFKKGNGIKRSFFQYNVEDDENLADRIAALFSEDFLSSYQGKGVSSEQPVFILGMPRSGTTLVEQILASHSQVYGAGELEDMNRLVNKLPDGMLHASGEGIDGLGRDYLQVLRHHGEDSARITDKMPQNFLNIGLMALALPGAKIINCQRDPADICLSCYTQLFMGGLSFAYDLAELGRYYQLYAKLMDHWHRVLPGRILDVRYEDVITDQESESRRMIDFLGLEWQDVCLDFHKSKRPVSTASSEQVRRPIYKSSLKRWQRYQKHLGPLLKVFR